ncbi:MAG: N-acetylneuraminate synthase [Muribaculaceae bacterium]|nr:N-acetylneuraminate synthase [Muribaculaceae bacterium]
MTKTLIIAEAGVNHNGSLELALKLVEEAARAGADIVKFQTFKAENLVSAAAKKAAYQTANDPSEDDSQLNMLRGLELSESDFHDIADYCEKCGIGFLSTPFDEESVDMLHSMGMRVWKIPSGEITNFPLLRKIGALKEEVIMSTGMCEIAEIEEALSVLEEFGTPRSEVILLHCTTQYPAPLESVNLLAMDTLKNLGCKSVGYSDHTEGVLVPVAAAARGAAVIEKHFTLSREMPGPDHKASLEPAELAGMVAKIREVEVMLGSSEKNVTAAESPNVAVARKSIVASRPVAKGEMFSEQNITAKRPGTGISPMCWRDVIGKQARFDFDTDEQIRF